MNCWVDGIYLAAGQEDEKSALLCVLGLRADEQKELSGCALAIAKAPRIGLACCGIYVKGRCPSLAGDRRWRLGNLAELSEVWPGVRRQPRSGRSLEGRVTMPPERADPPTLRGIARRARCRMPPIGRSMSPPPQVTSLSGFWPAVMWRVWNRTVPKLASQSPPFRKCTTSGVTTMTSRSAHGSAG